MRISIARNPQELGLQASRVGAEAIRRSLRAQGFANIILATGASQFETLRGLVAAEGIDWTRVVVFHLDEYLGLDVTHPASFRKFLRERFVDRLPVKLKQFIEIDGQADSAQELARLSQLISAVEIDVAFIGIGENAHLAFNDPPADFQTTHPYLVVQLDQACRQQQLGEGWFPSLEAVPTQAISMSIREILRAKQIICSVPDDRKSEAVAAAVEGPLTPSCPASALRVHPQIDLFIDEPAARRLQCRGLIDSASPLSS